MCVGYDRSIFINAVNEIAECTEIFFKWSKIAL